MYNLAGGRQIMTFFDDVRIPLDCQLGDVNRAWQQIWFRLGGERLDKGAPGPNVREGRLAEVFDMVIEYCKETKRNGRLLSEDPVVRAKLADLMIGIDSLKMFEFENFWRATTGNPADYGGYLAAAYYKEFWPRFAQECMEILGPLSIVYAGKYAPLAGAVEQLYRTSFGNHAGGTSQVKRMVVATRGLGLPRG
jgi:alkylation response protein AidB-like acyl-CoA dehydrogenase